MAVTKIRIQNLIDNKTPCIVTYDFLGTQDEVVQHGIFTGLPGGNACLLTSKWINGNPNATVIQDFNYITNITELSV